MFYTVQIEAVVGYQRLGWVQLDFEGTLHECGELCKKLQDLKIKCRVTEAVAS